MTSAWMKTNATRYEPFIPGNIRQYCETQIEPYGIEIDHIGLMALSECLIQPAGFAVEVIYLDRSEGDEVNIHRFDNSGDGLVTPADAPVLRLLYRPCVSRTENIGPLLTATAAGTTISCTKAKTRPSRLRSTSRPTCRWPSSRVYPSNFSRLRRRHTEYRPILDSLTISARSRTRGTSGHRSCRFQSSSPRPSSRCHSRQQPSETRRSTRVTSKARTSSPRSTNRRRPRRRHTGDTRKGRTRDARTGARAGRVG